jgi:nucleotide-binding universal stress UspA family protein
MTEVLACVDASSYARSVCDHAAWFASRLDCPTRVLHAVEDITSSDDNARSIIRAALEVLLDEGVDVCRGQVYRAPLADAANRLAPEMVVMGKRGTSSDQERGSLGSNVAAMLKAVDAPICLASQVFLPIRRALAVLDADMDHRRAVEFVGSHPGLRDLDIDVIIATAAGQDAEAKIAWSRSALEAREADVFGVAADSLLSAIETYTQSRQCDLVIVSRAVISSDVSDALSRLEARGIWSWRTPILVC